MLTPRSPTKHDSGAFICDCDEVERSACKGELLFKKHDGKGYCVLHYPGVDKKEEFQIALNRKLSEDDFDFRGVWFPEDISFQKRTFTTVANFSYARFSGVAAFDEAQFDGAAYFNRAYFEGNAIFFDTRFCGLAAFSLVQFNAIASFNYAQFNVDVDFSSAMFDGNAYFQHTKFIKTDACREVNSSNEAVGAVDGDDAESATTNVFFSQARFKADVSFERNEFGDHALVSFAAAVFEKAERVFFHTIDLRPHYFLNVDSRKFNFINVDWGSLDSGDAVRKEIDAARRVIKELEGEQSVERPQLLAITFRQLAVNAEDNNRYEEAANFRYMAMDAKRVESGFVKNLLGLSWWYWAVSGYGERVWRAFTVMFVTLVLFAALYRLGDATWWQPKQASNVGAESNAGEKRPPVIGRALTLPDALIYSLGVMALQKPEPLPANKRAKGLVLLETILGPLQAALLALAIRRKFMR